MILNTWRLLHPYIRRPIRGFALLGCSTALAGILEAMVLVIVVNVALAITQGTASDSIVLPIFDSAASSGALLWVAAGGALFIFLLHTATARLTSKLSTDVLESGREQALRAYLQASWPAQARDREGALQETVSTLAVQSSTLCVAFATAISAFLSLAALVLSAFLVDPVAMIVIIAVGLVLFAAIRPMSRLTFRRATAFVGANSEFSEEVSRIATMAMEFRLFGVQDRLQQELLERNRRVAVEQRRTRFASLSGSYLYRDLAALFLVGAVAALDLAGNRMAQIGAIVLLVVRALAYATLLQGMVQAMSEFSPNLAALGTRLRSLSCAAETCGSAAPRYLGDVEFHNVSYEYEPGEEAVHGVSVRIGNGETVGIVGPSGSGKSTLVQILLRLRRPTSGQVTVASVPYEEIAAPSWARLVALVPQEPKLIQATIEDNIRFWRTDISREDIERAADAAHVGDEIRSLPDGFDTKLGPRGTGLSGGQKQRVAIARALAGKPQLLVLDEPTSALDRVSEERLRETISGLHGSMTIVIVAHRESTLRVCNRLVALRNGVLDDVGAHQSIDLSDNLDIQVLDSPDAESHR